MFSSLNMAKALQIYLILFLVIEIVNRQDVQFCLCECKISAFVIISTSCCLLDTPVKKKKLGKNPDVDTSFLPDREREVIVLDFWYTSPFKGCTK